MFTRGDRTTRGLIGTKAERPKRFARRGRPRGEVQRAQVHGDRPETRDRTRAQTRAEQEGGVHCGQQDEHDKAVLYEPDATRRTRTRRGRSPDRTGPAAAAGPGRARRTRTTTTSKGEACRCRARRTRSGSREGDGDRRPGPSERRCSRRKEHRRTRRQAQGGQRRLATRAGRLVCRAGQGATDDQGEVQHPISGLFVFGFVFALSLVSRLRARGEMLGKSRLTKVRLAFP